MSNDLEHLKQTLSDAGLITEDRAADVNATITQMPGANRESFIGKLVVNGTITQHQADAVLGDSVERLQYGDYILLEPIGQGGMGSVYKARHRHMDRIVAIKLLLPEFTRTERLVNRFYREIKVAAQLNHPNIVTAYDASSDHGEHYLVMEYVKGKDLDGVVKKYGPMAVGKALDFIIQAARGLAYAHDKGVIHRDVKPANILLAADGTIRLLDMGLARLSEMESSSADISLTNTGQIMGTAAYMAPEHASNPKNADARSDIYSLGASLFQLLVGRSPFGGTTVVEVIIANREQPVPDIRPLYASSSPEVVKAVNDLQAILVKMLAKDPADRYETMDLVLADLEEARKRLPEPLEKAHLTKDAAERLPGLSSDAPIPRQPSWHTVEHDVLSVEEPLVEIATPQPTSPAPDWIDTLAPADIGTLNPSPRQRFDPRLLIGGLALVMLLLLTGSAVWFFWLDNEDAGTTGNTTIIVQGNRNAFPEPPAVRPSAIAPPTPTVTPPSASPPKPAGKPAKPRGQARHDAAQERAERVRPKQQQAAASAPPEPQPAAATRQAPAAPREPAPIAEDAINLIAHVQPDNRQLVRRGSWSLEDGVLHASPNEVSTLIVPYSLPPQYRLQVVAETAPGAQNSRGVLSLQTPHLWVRPHIMLDRPQKDGTYATVITKSTSSQPYTQQPGQRLEAGRMHDVVITSQAAQLRTGIDGENIVTWHANIDPVPPAGTNLSEAVRTRYFTLQAAPGTQIHALRLVSLGGQAIQLPQPSSQQRSRSDLPPPRQRNRERPSR